MAIIRTTPHVETADAPIVTGADTPVDVGGPAPFEAPLSDVDGHAPAGDSPLIDSVAGATHELPGVDIDPAPIGDAPVNEAPVNDAPAEATTAPEAPAEPVSRAEPEAPSEPARPSDADRTPEPVDDVEPADATAAAPNRATGEELTRQILDDPSGRVRDSFGDTWEVQDQFTHDGMGPVILLGRGSRTSLRRVDDFTRQGFTRAEPPANDPVFDLVTYSRLHGIDQREALNPRIPDDRLFPSAREFRQRVREDMEAAEREGRPLVDDFETNETVQAMLDARGASDPLVRYRQVIELLDSIDFSVSRSRHNEADVRRDVEASVAGLGGELRKTQYSIKSEESSMRKVAVDGKTALERSAEDLTQGLSDAVRYTVEFDDSNMVDGVFDIKSEMEARGYRVVQNAEGQPKIKNGFFDGSGFKGVNMQFVRDTPSGPQRVEIRVHTPRSFEADEATVAPYQAIRHLETQRAAVRDDATLSDSVREAHLAEIDASIVRLTADKQSISDSVPLPVEAHRLDALGVPLISGAGYRSGN